MGDDTEGKMEIAPPPKKRSLFTKSISFKAATMEDGVDFFSRAKELHPQRLLEEQRKREKKLEKLERKRSTISAEAKSCTPPGGKRRRVSTSRAVDEGHLSDNSHHDEDMSWTKRESSTSTPGSRKSRPSSSQAKPQVSPTSLSERYTRDLNARKKEVPAPAAISISISKSYIVVSDSESDDEPAKPARKPINKSIYLEDDDDLYSAPRIVSRPPPPPAPPKDDFQISDDEEFPELVLAARAREKKRAEDKAREEQAFAEKNHAPGGEDLDDDIFDIEPRRKRESDPAVEILITSKMPEMVPLVVKRKLSGRLKEVRLSWCDKQISSEVQVGPNFRDGVFLTWDSKKLYDYSTCNALGLKVDEDGRLVNGDGTDTGGKVHLQAWTEEAFQNYQKKLEAQQRKLRNDSPEEPVAEEAKEPKLKLILKAKDKERKLVVKPSTQIERLIIAFREHHEIPEEKVITLYFDGDKLDPQDTVGDTEIEDMDNIEVHIE